MPRGRLTILPKFWQNAKVSPVPSRRTDASIIVADNVTRDPSAHRENGSMLGTWGQRVNHYLANLWLATSAYVCCAKPTSHGCCSRWAPSRPHFRPGSNWSGQIVWSSRVGRTLFRWPLGVVTSSRSRLTASNPTTAPGPSRSPESRRRPRPTRLNPSPSNARWTRGPR